MDSYHLTVFYRPARGLVHGVRGLSYDFGHVWVALSRSAGEVARLDVMPDEDGNLCRSCAQMRADGDDSLTFLVEDRDAGSVGQSIRRASGVGAPYDLYSNSCVSATADVLRAAGLLKIPANVISPLQLWRYVTSRLGDERLLGCFVRGCVGPWALRPMERTQDSRRFDPEQAKHLYVSAPGARLVSDATEHILLNDFGQARRLFDIGPRTDES